MTHFVLRAAALPLALAALFFAAPFPHPAAAQSSCGAPSGDATDLIFLTAPAGAIFGPISGPPPLLVTIAISDGVVLFPAGYLNSSFDWGDGASSAVSSVPCLDGEAAWPGQTHSHTYAAPGEYQVTWNISLAGQQFAIPILFVTVANQPAPTPTEAPATPTPIATPQPAPTPTPVASASPTAATAAFLTWHVLFGRERENFSGLREASSLTVLVIFVAYTLLTLGVWGFFRRRKAVAV